MSQRDYAVAFERYCEYHKIKPDRNPNRVTRDLYWFQLMSPIFYCAADLIAYILCDVLKSKNRVASLCKLVLWSVFTDVFSNFVLLISTCRGDIDSFKNFEVRFSAAVFLHSTRWIVNSLVRDDLNVYVTFGLYCI